MGETARTYGSYVPAFRIMIRPQTAYYKRNSINIIIPTLKHDHLFRNAKPYMRSMTMRTRFSPLWGARDSRSVTDANNNNCEIIQSYVWRMRNVSIDYLLLSFEIHARKIISSNLPNAQYLVIIFERNKIRGNKKKRE